MMNKKQRGQMEKDRSHKKRIKLLQIFGLSAIVAILTIGVILSLPEGAENANQHVMEQKNCEYKLNLVIMEIYILRKHLQ